MVDETKHEISWVHITWNKGQGNKIPCLLFNLHFHTVPFFSRMKLYFEHKELMRGCQIGKEKNLTHTIMSKDKQHPADNQNFKACEKKNHVDFHRSVRYFCSPAAFLLSHFWEIQLVYTAKTLKHCGKSTQTVTKLWETKATQMPRVIFLSLSFYPCPSLCVSPSGQWASWGLERFSDRWHQRAVMLLKEMHMCVASGLNALKLQSSTGINDSCPRLGISGFLNINGGG